MLNKVKTALRIAHSNLNNDICDTIETARAEMIRAGISVEKANDDNDYLISMAIKTYCLSVYAEDAKQIEGYQKSWKYQLDNLRKSKRYRKGGVANE